MAEANPRNDDEIDLIELFTTMWRGKWIIAVYTAISLLGATVYLTLVEPKYESRIIIKQNIIPPFLEIANIAPAPAPAIEDFIDKFYSQENFEIWAQQSSGQNISFEDFSQTFKSNGRIFSSDTSVLLAYFDKINGIQVELVVRSKDTEIINAFFNYSQFLAELLLKDYRKISNEEIIFIKQQVQQIGAYSDHIIDILLNTKRYLKDIDDSKTALRFKHPTQPHKTQPNSVFILALAGLLGGFIGCGTVWVLKVFRQLNKSYMKT